LSFRLLLPVISSEARNLSEGDMSEQVSSCHIAPAVISPSCHFERSEKFRAVGPGILPYVETLFWREVGSGKRVEKPVGFERQKNEKVSKSGSFSSISGLENPSERTKGH
jgi:hypothetical protein